MVAKQTSTLFDYAYAAKEGVVVLAEQEPISCYHLKRASWHTLIEALRRYPGITSFQQVNEHQFKEHLIKIYETRADLMMQQAHADLSDTDFTQLAATLEQNQELLDSNNDAPIIRLINAILNEAVKENASDVHIETFEGKMHVRFRVDGELRLILEPSKHIAPLIVSRVKVMAKLDISERRVPQDGRISLKVAGHSVDVRVSTLPNNHGERLVLRILDQAQRQLKISQLGLPPNTHRQLAQLIEKPHGILLVTGPTGSGKTTTLYAALCALETTKKNIMTIEDPIEYDLPGINQTPVSSKTHLSFAAGLRAILRQDPDVIMVGEIRDQETAKIAVQASMTGHLVLSTLHTNSAVAAMTRLIDMGIEPFLLASTLEAVMAQRLVRKLCPACKEPLADNRQAHLTRYRAVGCVECRQTGYTGRVAMYELVIMDATLRQMVHDRAPEHEQRRYAQTHFPTLLEEGKRLVETGITTLEEIQRCVQEH